MRRLFDARWPLLFGGALVAGFGTLGHGAWVDFRTFDDEPKRGDLRHAIDASARGRQWVTIGQAPWQCDEEIRNVKGGVCFIPARTDEGQLVVARFDRKVSCQTVAAHPLSGIVEPMEPDLLARLRDAGLSAPEGASARSFSVCESCGRENARLGVILCSLFVLLGLSLYPLRIVVQGLWTRANVALYEARAPVVSVDLPRAVRTMKRWGGVNLVVGVLATVWGAGYLIFEIPLRWAGIGLICFGALQLLFPARVRALLPRKI